MEKDFKKVLKDNLSLLHKSVCGIIDESHTEDSALIFLLHIHPSLGYHCTKCMQQVSTADVMSLFSIHKCYKLSPIFLRTVSMSTLYFTLLCEDNTDRAFLLKRLKQIFCSNLMGLASILNFKGTTAESTEILYRGKKSISSSPDFLFRSKFRHYFHMFPPAGTRFNTFQHTPRKFQFAAKIDWCIGISLRPGEVEMKILQSWRQALPSSPLPQSTRASLHLPLAPKINLARDPNK